MKQDSNNNHCEPRPISAESCLPPAWSALAVLLLLTTSCGGGGSASNPAPTASVPDFSAATFTHPTVVDHPLWNFPADVAATYATASGPDAETIIVERVPGVRNIMGIDCIRVRDRVFADGLLIEDTEDWYAQDDAGNVWYMGEAVIDYEYDADGNVIGTATDGSWEAGLDPLGNGAAALPGYAMRASPAVGDFDYQEYYEGEAEDIGRVVALNVPITLADGSMHSCVQVQATSALDPTADEYKYYAPGVGLVREEQVGTSESSEFRGRFVMNASSRPTFSAGDFTNPDTITHPLFPLVVNHSHLYFASEEDETETILVERLPGTRVVLGIACARVRDRVYQDGLLVEDTEDWFAQDDAGNVWYMGEEVDNYEYDEDGVLLGSDHDGSWEAGLDVAGTGTNALPGYQLPAVATTGTVYYQEFYPDEAEDMGLIVTTNASVTLPDGRTFSNCVRALDWNPLDADGLEYKLYAPGVGLVQEIALHENERLSSVGSFDRSSASIPSLAGATFSMSTLIDNPLQPFPSGANWEYEAETEDGLETIVIEVLPTPRVVMGVTCVAVRDQVFLEGVIIEDTEDWFAQDDDGNVWYFGEAVINYEYDDTGVLLGTNSDGSWEAGLDVAGVGAIAQPGIQMWASPMVGMSYFQEFYAGSAEDMAWIVATNVSVTTPGGETHVGCVQTLDWNPLEPHGLEYKWYAPGVGFVYESKLHEEEELELVDTSL